MIWISLFCGLILLVGCTTISQNVSQDHYNVELYHFEHLPEVGKTDDGKSIILSSFSGLLYEGIDQSNGNKRFMTHTDRGPNAKHAKLHGNKVKCFILPGFQPQWVRFELSETNKQLLVVQTIPLHFADGRPFSGLPNKGPDTGRTDTDEIPVDFKGHLLKYDPMGEDLEGITRDTDGSYWMVDEYGPSILHFTSKGCLLSRYVPKGGNEGGIKTGTEALPAAYRYRQMNRGFEGVAFENGKIYAFLESPLKKPKRKVAEKTPHEKGVTRILVFDTKREQTTAEYLYRFETPEVNMVKDACSLGNDRFLIIEQNLLFGKKASRKIFLIDLKGATNILNDSSKHEQAVTVKKELVVDLVENGLGFVKKWEGLALIDSQTLALVNDNDFDVGNIDVQMGIDQMKKKSTGSYLAIIHLKKALQ